MIDHAKRLREVFKTELERIKLGDVVGYALDGPTLVPANSGQLTLGWHIMVSLKHNKLIGEPDEGVAVPIMGPLPPDEVFQRGASYLLEEARRLRYEKEHPESIKESQSLPLTSDGSPIPPGLIPAGTKAEKREVPTGARPAKVVQAKVENEGEESETSGGLKVLDKRGKR